ncbi:MAG: ABC transporter permease [Planctomycetota bacterium]|nr:ABC transporter permease [Planctomycetota bacterium]
MNTRVRATSQRIWALVIKEFLALLRDPKSRLVIIVPPMIQMIIFSYAATQEVRNVHLGVFSEDGGAAAQEFVSRFVGSPTFTRVRLLHGMNEVHEVIDAQDALLVVHIGPTFSRDLAAGKPAAVQYLLDGRRANAAQIVLGYATSVGDRFARDWPAAPGSSRGRNDAAPASIVVSRAWFNANLDSVWSTVPALVGIIITLIGLLITALSVARERELGTFEQLLVSPLRPAEILAGKTIPALVLGMGEGLLMTLVARFVFRVPLVGSVALLAVVMFVFLLAVVGIGLFISSLAKTQQQAVLGAFAFMLPGILLSGFATPVENMPAWLRALTYINPVRYFLVLAKGIFLEGLGPAVALANLWPMAILAVVTLAAAGWLFRHRLE